MMTVQVSIFVSSFYRENITIFDPLIPSINDQKLAIYSNKSLTLAQRVTALTFPILFLLKGPALCSIPRRPRYCTVQNLERDEMID
jgi:hypothetical protein